MRKVLHTSDALQLTHISTCTFAYSLILDVVPNAVKHSSARRDSQSRYVDTVRTNLEVVVNFYMIIGTGKVSVVDTGSMK